MATIPVTPYSLGVCYYPEQWDSSKWPEDLTAMRELGLRYVRIGEFAWSCLEPAPGKYQFGWLQQVLNLAAERSLSVVLGTPTATPPKWLVDRMPDLLPIDQEGRPKKFGSRRHYCFSHLGYRAESARIVTKLAETFGQHPALAAWQTDNEYGCHGTILSYSESARVGFRAWLQDKYQAIDRLNQAWGNVFWSMEYESFDEIELPNLTVTDPNPAHVLDFRRFSSDQVKSFNREQVEIIRRLSPGRTILHNFMGEFLAFDHFDVASDLDAASWDSYPLGALSLLDLPESHKRKFLRSGDPDFPAFHHDLYRSCGRGRWWVMEQQPGPVNWAPYNPSPYPGMVRLWTHEAFAHGAEVVSYFRWRQAPFAQEQMHTGINRPDSSPDVATAEIRETVNELASASFQRNHRSEAAPVGLIFDYEAAWTLATQPNRESFDYFTLALSFYRSARRLGLNVDILPQTAKLDTYKLLLVPSLPILGPELIASLKTFRGSVVIGPRTGSKTSDFQIPSNLPPGPLQELFPMRVVRAESLPDFEPIPLSWRGVNYECRYWMEHIETSATPWITSANGNAVAFTHEAFTYLATVPEQSLLDAMVEDIVSRTDVPTMLLPDGLRTRVNGDLRYFFNYGPTKVSLPAPKETEFIVGGPELPVAGVAIIAVGKSSL
ncbi:MAG: beta-galactosidase [Verrucomicrobia bacterium]|nr:beta-galactosidase [Verrucomicrobiota bacterium]MBV8483779.1 beta-galactosidase [Verrucomicrobiota bacterium]